MKRSPKPTAMASAWTTSASASARRPAPSARAIADEIPPPMAPADIICISISTGKTSATPASASVPSLATKYVSMSPTDACTNMTSTFGVASRRSVLAMGPSTSTRVRVSKRDAVAADAVLRVMRRDRLREHGHAGLRHGVRVDRKGLGGLQAEDRTDVDDRAATLALHVRDHRPGEAEHSLEEHVHHAVPDRI